MSQPPSPGPPDPDRPASPWEQPTAGPEPPSSRGYDPQQPPGQGPPQDQPQWGQQPQGDQPQWGQQQPYHMYGPPRRPATNVLAVLSLVFAFVFAPAGIVLGHLAQRQLRTSGEAGGQLATWGLILSYIFTALGLLACCGWVALVAIGGNDGGTY
ncbi:DUF4190 domain-containing protein [Salinispora arenicola]|uniref:Uncharacterized protein DUF4190 n=1 Tax=Salinispora arenicola TaxID=168697 RepID=A0A542XI93_SALAC|nr:DUF4190 domain-containing protein [Salinispora arenicola]MCN0152306.1 DUF4190 domain-containing protein [Salinispora arenicola]NIL42088.1 DUF4190 domain-containing protein [Salinispora arenicola]NIL57376.1 DUF4190 domain-containing protein [Salinispora arenicola]NIL62020.1 DUF4190 domain-containing protein [Salinispora arenicola]TQL35555.1 uncharacterized protein DUF4190 [Salinispora arenicola]